eukprot:7773697-Alexandrium_andersonii.AAC.1
MGTPRSDPQFALPESSRPLCGARWKAAVGGPGQHEPAHSHNLSYEAFTNTLRHSSDGLRL